MTKQEKLILLEEMLDMEEGTLSEEMEIQSLENWNSMAAISLIALMDENFNKKISAVEIKQFKKVQDILDVME